MFLNFKKVFLTTLFVSTCVAGSAFADTANCLNNVTASILWVNNNASVATPDGSLSSPYASLADALAAKTTQTEICIATSATAYSYGGSVSGVNVHGGFDVDLSAQTVAQATANVTTLELSADVSLARAALTNFTINSPSGTDNSIILSAGTVSLSDNVMSFNHANDAIQLLCSEADTCLFNLENNTVTFTINVAIEGATYAVNIKNDTTAVAMLANVINNKFSIAAINDNSQPISPVFLGTALSKGMPFGLNALNNSFEFSASHDSLQSLEGLNLVPYNTTLYGESTVISGNTFDFDISNNTNTSNTPSRLRGINIESTENFLGAANYKIEKNLIKLNGTAQKVFGFQQNYETNPVNSVEIKNNQIYITGNFEDTNGIVFTADETQNQKIYNNTIIMSGNTGESYGIRFSFSHGGEIINNIVYADDTVGEDAGRTEYGALIWVSKPKTATEIKIAKLQNNLLFDRANSHLFGDYDADSGKFFTATTEISVLEAKDPTNFSGNISADPLFIDEAAGNFGLLIASPAIDAGLDLTASNVTDDFLGNPRTGLFDIGALEYAIFYRDADGDGFGDLSQPEALTTATSGFVSNSLDCDDADAEVIDVNQNWYVDADVDTFGDATATAVVQCTRPLGHVLNNSDCDDADATKNLDCSEVDGAIDATDPTVTDDATDVDGVDATDPTVTDPTADDVNENVDATDPTVTDPTATDPTADGVDPQIGDNSLGSLHGGGMGCQLNPLAANAAPLSWVMLLLPSLALVVVRARKANS